MKTLKLLINLNANARKICILLIKNAENAKIYVVNVILFAIIVFIHRANVNNIIYK